MFSFSRCVSKKFEDKSLNRKPLRRNPRTFLLPLVASTLISTEIVHDAPPPLPLGVLPRAFLHNATQQNP